MYYDRMRDWEIDEALEALSRAGVILEAKHAKRKKNDGERNEETVQGDGDPDGAGQDDRGQD